MAYLHSRSYGWNLALPARRSFVVVYKSCSDFSDLCHDIAIIWLLGTLAFDDLGISCHCRMICMNLRQYCSLRDLFHQNLSLCWPTGRKLGIWKPVWTNLYSITILRSILYGEIIWGVCKVYYKEYSDILLHILCLQGGNEINDTSKRFKRSL